MIRHAISVVIPTCNRPELLERSIRSVLAQTIPPMEIIVVDDGDVRSEEVVHRMADPRVKYVMNNPPRQGGGATRNKGIEMAQGDWIAFQDDDDEWLNEKLAVQLGAIDKSTEPVDFVFSSVVNDFEHEQRTTQVPSGISDFHQYALRRFNGFLTVTLVIRKSILQEVGGFDLSLPSHQDPELMIRITQKSRGIGVNQPLVRVNMRERAHVGGSLKRRIEGRKSIIEKHSAEFEPIPDILARHYFQIALWCRDSGDGVQALVFMKKALYACWSIQYMIHYVYLMIKFYRRHASN